MFKRFLMIFMALTLAVGGCAFAEGDGGMERGIKDFSAKLFSAVRKDNDGENMVLSPLSAYVALSMLAEGASGETAAQLEAVLGITREEAKAAYGQLSDLLSEEAGNTVMSLANALFVDASVEVREAFISALQDEYRAEIFVDDLQKEGMVDEVNAWISEKTREMIPEMLDRIDPDDVMLLINALYMNAEWQVPFSAEKTHTMTFTRSDGEAIDAEFLSMDGFLDLYFSDDKVEGVALPYDDEFRVFLAVKPVKGKVQDIEITRDTIDGWMSAMGESGYAALRLPKFDTRFKVELDEVLKGLGMVDAFDSQAADFTQMGESKEGKLVVGRVLQEVAMRVDEEGTEAAAATMIGMKAAAAFLEDEPKQLYFDSPFLYMVIDVRENLPLFIGVMEDPTK